MARQFLTARWENLALITYAVDPDLVQKHLPAGCEPDLVDGRARCSLVAFDFLDCRVFGVKWPGYTHFPEVNLRLYAKRDGVRGIVFFSEFVPKRAICWIAKATYNEPYTRWPMRSRSVKRDGGLSIEHTLTVRGREQTIRVRGDGPATVPDAASTAAWVKEHAWGFGQTHRGRPLTYHVDHPEWAVYADARADLAFDYGHVYGPEWAFLNAAEPDSVVLAAGSAVSIAPKRLDAAAKPATVPA